MTRLAAITFDVDWAPDWCVDRCIELCAELGIPATFFVTHATPVLTRVRENARMEIGIHPNFLPNSTQGHGVEEVVSFCMGIAPEARAMRTHALMQSTPLLEKIVRLAPQIETDLSLYLPDHDHLRPIDMYFEDGGHLTRLPYLWEDDMQAMKPGYDWSPVIPDAGLCIYDVHPIHLCLNMREMGRYRALMASLNGKPLGETTPDDMAPFINVSERGVAQCLKATVDSIGQAGFVTVSEITRLHRAGDPG